MKSHKQGFILKTAFLFERLLAMVVLIAIFLGTIDIIRTIWDAYIINYHTVVQYSELNDMLGQILLLVIGVELVVMLSLHIPGAIIEALLYAIARKMLLLPKASGMGEILLGVIAIAGLFAIKKYLASGVGKEKKSLDVTTIHFEEEKLREADAKLQAEGLVKKN